MPSQELLQAVKEFCLSRLVSATVNAWPSRYTDLSEKRLHIVLVACFEVVQHPALCPLRRLEWLATCSCKLLLLLEAGGTARPLSGKAEQFA